MLEKFEGEKRKQQIILGLAIVVGLGIIFIVSTIFGSTPKKQNKEMPKIEVVDDRKVEEEPFKKIYGEKIGILEKQIEDLQKELQMTNEMLKDLRNRPVSPSTYAAGEFSEPEVVSQQNEKNKPGPVIQDQPQPPQPVPPVQPVPLPGISNNQQKKPQITVKLLDSLIVVEGNIDHVKHEEVVSRKDHEDKKDKKKKKTIENTIPAGSFVRAVLLSGLDAPTSGNAVRNPHPVLLKIVDKAILPNKWKTNIKDCFFIGTGYGDLSSERAYIRLERLSCTRTNGDIISKTVDGYISGEDGKNGLKGRVVSKQGQLLARTLLAGFLEGMSKAFTYSQQTLLISPQGAVQTVNPDKAIQYAGLSGVSEAAKKLADFYMNLVNKTFPVIEILPGRKVDVVFLKDVSLEE